MDGMTNGRRGVFGAAAMAWAAGASADAVAAPAQVGTHALGFHRVRVGEIEVTALLDGGMQGTNEGIARFFPDSTLETTAPLRERAFFDPRGLHQPVAATSSTPGGRSSWSIAARIPRSSRRRAGRSPRCAPRVMCPNRSRRCF